MRFQSRQLVLITTAGAICLTGAAPLAHAGSHEPAVASTERDQAKRAWHEEAPPTSPAQAGSGAMAYHAAEDRTILFGGSGSTEAETWAWDGSTWEQLHPETSPPGRDGHVMAYDPVREEIVSFGGGGLSPPMNDTWVFSGGEWAQRHPATSPFGVHSAAMAFDPNLQQVVLFGGLIHNNSVDDMFAWDGTTWTELTPPTKPRRRAHAGFAYDKSRDALILFGGTDYDGSAPPTGLRDTWSWDGETWTEVDVRRSPSTRAGAAMAPFGRRVGLFGGSHSPPPAAPVARDARSTEPDGMPSRKLRDTWVLKDNTWRKLRLDPAPSARSSASVTWDAARHEVVLFSGFDASNDTWTLRRQQPGS